MKIVQLFNDLKISQKILVLIALSAIVTGLIGGFAGSMIAGNNILEKQEDDMRNTLNEAQKFVNGYLAGLEDDLRQVAQSQMTASIIEEFDAAWNQFENPKTFLQDAYIKKNPYPLGEKDKLNASDDGTYYSSVHERFHNIFKTQKDAKGYYDIFLFNKNGDLIYSVYKEADFATNMNDGAWKDTDLAQTFQEIAAKKDPSFIAFKDFQPYKPSADAPASFIAMGVFDQQNNFVGAVAYQMPIGRFNNLFKMSSKSYALYVVGSDNLLRNDLPQTKNDDLLSTKPRIDNVYDMENIVLEDQKGLIYDTAIYAIDTVNFHDTRWSLILEFDQSIIDNAIFNTKFFSLLATFIGATIASIAGLFFSRKISSPIVQFADTINQLANGYEAQIPCINNKDELGILARSLTKINDRSREASRVSGALNSAASMVMISNEDLEVVFVNISLDKFLRENEHLINEAIPDLDTRNFIGADISHFFLDQRSNIQSILGTLHTSYQTNITLGNLYIKFVITPAYDNSGNRIGFILDWTDTTQEVYDRIEADQRKLHEQEIEQQVAEIIQAAASGNFKERLHINDDRQSIISISNGINKICETVDDFFKELSETVDAFAHGDLTKSIDGTYDGQFEDVKESLNNSFQSLAKTVKKISDVGHKIHKSSDDISSGSDELSTRTEAQAASIEQTVATMEEMSASVRNNADSAIKVSGLAQETLQQAEDGKNIVLQAVSAMSQIETSAHRITEIVSVIDSIASQTNLLALNAAVEAARAGEAGKGFAVVASEVRTLASRCSDAARDIRGLIAGSNAQVVDGVKLVNATGKALNLIVESVTNVTETIASISLSSKEQATGVEEISSAISQMDEITQQNAGLADNSAANARLLTKEAELLAELIRGFKIDIYNANLKEVNSQLVKERQEFKPTATIAATAKTPTQNFQNENAPERQNNVFSDFGVASGDDWADL